jgi:hypothetical protein
MIHPEPGGDGRDGEEEYDERQPADDRRPAGRLGRSR